MLCCVCGHRSPGYTGTKILTTTEGKKGVKIVIIGDGKVGYKLARQLSVENYDVVMIDSNEKKLNMLWTAWTLRV